MLSILLTNIKSGLPIPSIHYRWPC